MNQDATPLAGSSQNSQRNKRKLTEPEDSQQSATKRNYVDESDILQSSDFMFDQSEFPSQLASPSVVIPPRPNLKKKRMSTTEFTQAIQSQASTQSKEEDITDVTGESSIPSALGSPEEVLSQRPERQNKRFSTSAFTKTLGKKPVQEVLIGAIPSASDSSDLNSTGIPSNLESPDYASSQQPGKLRRRVSSTGFKNILKKPQVEQDRDKSNESSEKSNQEDVNNSEVESPVLISTKRLGSKKRVSTTSFNKILELKPQDLKNAEDEPQEKISNPSFNVSRLRGSMGKRSFMAASALELLEFPATQTVEETKLEDRNAPSLQPLLLSDDNSDLEQYLSRSDEEKTADSLANIVEFTAKVDEPSAPATSAIADEGKEASTIEAMVEQLTHSRDKRLSTASTEPVQSTNLDLDSTVKVKRIESAEILSKSSDTDLSDTDMPGLESPQAFSPIASSTQLMKRRPSVIDATATEEPLEVLQPGTTTKESNQSPASSQKEKSVGSSSSSLSTSEIPSKLDSPADYKEYRRPGPSASKRRISTTGFVAALSQKSAHTVLPESSLKALSPGSMTQTPGTPVESRTPETRRKTATPKVDQTSNVTRSSSRTSNNPSVSRKSSATPSLPESGTFLPFKIPFNSSVHLSNFC